MGYCINENNNKGTNVPNIIFERLANTNDDFIRIALYIVSNNNCNPNQIAKALNIKQVQNVEKALLFWQGAGLLNSLNIQDENNKNTTEEKNEKKHRTHLTSSQVSQIASENDRISFLLQECQRLIGGVVTQGDCNIFASMYICDAMPIDMILLGVAHFAANGKKNARYIERALLSWQREGINSGAAAEAYLHKLMQNEEYIKRAVSLFPKKADMRVSRAEGALICDWYEVYGFDEKIITEALSLAGEKNTIRYVNGILKKWYNEGYKNLQDIMRGSADKMQNISVSNPNAKNILNGAIKKAPVFVVEGDAYE